MGRRPSNKSVLKSVKWGVHFVVTVTGERRLGKTNLCIDISLRSKIIRYELDHLTSKKTLLFIKCKLFCDESVFLNNNSDVRIV